MEMEQRTPLMAKNLWRIIRAILYMVKRNLSKTIPWLELHMMIKRSGKIAGKAIGNLLLDHHHLQTLSCRHNDINSTFISPHEYQFSCSNTPLFYPKRKTNRHHRHHNQLAGKNGGLYRRSHKDNELTVNNVKRVFDILNDYETAAAATAVGVVVEPERSPLTALLGFGGSTEVRQLRVTDSPFPVDDTAAEDGGVTVDKAADEFIRNFYNELKEQKKRAAVELPSPAMSPSPYRSWDELR